MSTGDSFQTIAFSYRVGHSTVHKIVHETCDALWSNLVKEFMKVPGEAEWTSISEEFYERWNFPNCIGAIDGKHIMIQAPASSGSQYYNYKGSHSIVLMAVVDSRYRFVLIDVGAYGRNSDGGIFANSTFGKAYLASELNVPEDKPIRYRDSENMPFVIVGDEAFPLKPGIMRPYGGRGLSEEKRIFNYRLSRARRVSENAFGILAARWRLFRRLIHATPASVESYVKACCVLHNFLLEKNAQIYCPPGLCDNENCQAIIQAGSWREEPSGAFQTLSRTGSNNASKSANTVRDLFASYFVSPQGQLPWQFAHVRRGLTNNH